MEYIEVTGKSVDEAITNACLKLETSSDKIEYEVIDKGSNGLFGIFNSKPAKIKDDIGRVLGVGAVMTALCRTSACGFSLDECITLDAKS